MVFGVYRISDIAVDEECRMGSRHWRSDSILDVEKVEATLHVEIKK